MGKIRKIDNDFGIVEINEVNTNWYTIDYAHIIWGMTAGWK